MVCRVQCNDEMFLSRSDFFIECNMSQSVYVDITT